MQVDGEDNKLPHLERDPGFPENAENRDRPVEPGLYVLDQTFRKFIVRPDVDQMLEDLNVRRAENKVAAKVKQEQEDAAAELLRAAAPKPARKPAAKPKAKPTNGASKSKAKA